MPLNSLRHRAPALTLGLCLLALTPDAPAQSPPGQPYASYWHPSTILNWNPDTDPNAPFNRSNVPLATRIANPQNVNPNARVGQAGVTSLVAYAPTSNNPSQGSSVMKYYATNYWQYMDNLVFWGGSASEGLILAPNAPVIDAAHRNGVRVLGNVFFPPNVYGGQIGWVNDFLQQRNDGSFPVADKMIQAAQYYGFDGWFINQETTGGTATTAARMQQFIRYVHQRAPQMHVQWYDSMDRNGAINWQGALNANNSMYFDTDAAANSGRVSDSMFLDFRWRNNPANLASSANTAASLGRSRYELYAGVDVEGSGYNTSVNWGAIFPSTGHQTSLGLYRPEWTNNSAGSVADFYARDNRFWVGQNADPSNTTTASAWKGIANYIPAKSVVKSAPFVTNFNTGHGNRYAINGQQLASGEWNNLSLQDVLPTYRWLVTSTGTRLTPSLDFNDAYYGGTSLLVQGNLGAVNDLKLYQTEIPLAADTNFRIVLKPSASNPLVKLGVSFTDDPNSFTYIDVGAGMIPARWNTRVIPLGAHAGKTLANVALRFGDGTTILNGYSTRVGQFAIYNGTPRTPAPPTNPSVVDQLRVARAGATTTSLPLRVRWTHSTDTPYFYNLYRRADDTSLSFLGATPNNAYFVPAVRRISNENFVTLELETVGLDFGASPRTTHSFYVDWSRPSWNLTWQGNGSTNGGDGVWDAASLRWRAPGAVPANQFWSNLRNDTATFAGPAGTITITVPVTTAGLTFNDSGFTLAGANPITLTGAATVAIPDAAHSATINAPIAGTVGLRKTGSGTLLLGATNSFTGSTVVSGGTLRVAGSIATSNGVTVNAGATFEAAATQSLHSLTLTPGARAAVTPSAGGPSKVLKLGVLSLDPAASQLDLVDNDLILSNADLATVEAWLAAARNAPAGRWLGPGLTSSAAAANPLTTLAALLNPGLATFRGEPVAPTDVLVKYTYNGDANLDGRINSDDYFRIDSGFLAQPADPTYAQGDFNYDDRINSDDYFLIDSAFLGQGAPLTTASLPSAAPTVPEPTTLALLLFTALLSPRPRRR